MSKLLILAAGNSSRMKKELEGSGLDPELLKQANEMPKGMIGLGKNGRTFLDYQLYNASNAGFTEVGLVLNPKDVVTQPYYERLMAEDKAFGLTIKFARQNLQDGRDKPLGTADAVMQGLIQLPEWKNDHVTVCNSDNLYSKNVFGLLFNNKYPASMISYGAEFMGFNDEKIKNCAILFTDKEDFLEKLIEKPSDEQMEHCINQIGRLGISMNIFNFQYELGLEYMTNQPLNPIRNEKEMPEAISRMAQENPKTVKAYPVAEIMPDLTSKADILIVQKYLVEEFPDVQ